MNQNDSKNETLNKTEQEIYNKLEAQLIDKGVSKVDIEKISNQISENAKKSDAEVQKAIDEAVTKALDEQKANTNPFAKVQNIEVNQKVNPVGSLAIATVKAAQNHQSVESYLQERFSKNQATQADKAMIEYLGKSYYNSGNRAGLEKIKSLGIDSISSGAGFSDAGADSEFIKELRARSVVRQAGARIKALVNGRLNLNRGAANATSYWLGNGSAITESQPSYEQITLIAKKLGVLVPVDNDALRFDIHGMAAEVESDIIDAITLAEDEAFLEGTGSASQPKGLSNWVLSASSFARATTPTADKAGKDLHKLKQKLVTNNVRMVRPAIFMHPAVKSALEAQVDGNGVLKIYARTLQENNQILGANVFETTQLTSTTILMADMDEVVIGEGYDLIVESDSSYGFNKDQTYIRAVKSSDLQMRHEEGVSKITSVDWDTQLL